VPQRQPSRSTAAHRGRGYRQFGSILIKLTRSLPSRASRSEERLDSGIDGAELAELRPDGTLTRLATQGDAGLLGQAVRVLEFLDGRPAGAGPLALPALAAQITGKTKGAQPRDRAGQARPAGAGSTGGRSAPRVCREAPPAQRTRVTL
jgi:hypothetical protein